MIIVGILLFLITQGVFSLQSVFVSSGSVSYIGGTGQDYCIGDWCMVESKSVLQTPSGKLSIESGQGFVINEYLTAQIRDQTIELATLNLEGDDVIDFEHDIHVYDLKFEGDFLDARVIQPPLVNLGEANIDVEICNLFPASSIEGGVIVKTLSESVLAESREDVSLNIDEGCNIYSVPHNYEYLGEVAFSAQPYFIIPNFGLEKTTVGEVIEEVKGSSKGNDVIDSVVESQTRLYGESMPSSIKVVEGSTEVISADCSTNSCPEGFVCESGEFNGETFDVCNSLDNNEIKSFSDQVSDVKGTSNQETEIMVKKPNLQNVFIIGVLVVLFLWVVSSGK